MPSVIFPNSRRSYRDPETPEEKAEIKRVADRAVQCWIEEIKAGTAKVEDCPYVLDPKEIWPVVQKLD